MPVVLPQPIAAPHRYICAVLLTFGAMSLGAFGEEKRERKDVAIPPPPPVPLEMKVERGADVLIPLRIYGQRNQMLTFIIRKPPRTGRLSDLKNTSATTAVVHYRSTNDRNVHSDVFEYAVKSVEGVSAAVPVQIEIIDRPPELFGPAEVLFPPRLVGTTEAQTIELINRGGMATEGECHVEPPWRLESPAAYRVEPNGRLFVKVVFQPERAGDFLGDLRFSSQPDRAVVLRGIAQDALAVNPSPLRLALESTTLVRAGVFEVTNHTDAAQVVRVLADPRLRLEPELRLEPGRTAQVMVRTMADDAAAVDAEISLEAGEHRAKVVVNATPLPAVIRPVDRVVDLGIVPGGTVGAGQLSLRNVGGVAGSAFVSTSPPFVVPTQRIDLAAGATATVPVTLDGSNVGTIEQPIQVRSAGGIVSVPARAVIVAPGSGPSRMTQSSDDFASSKPRSAPSTPMPASVHDLDFDKPDARQVARPIVREATRCVLEWHVDLCPASTFVAQRRELDLQSGKLAIRWVDLPNFTVERNGELVRGSIERLKAGSHYTVRVLGVVGEKRTQVFETSFDTPRPGSRRGRSGWIALLSMIAVGLGALALWRRTHQPPKRAAALKKTQRMF